LERKGSGFEFSYSGHTIRMIATPRTIELRVRWLSFGFFLLFIAYSSAQLLQTVVNGPKGYICLFLVYSFFGVSSLLAPKLVSYFSATALLPLSAIGYVCMVAANIFSNEAFLAPSCAFVGICAATLWASQSVLIGASAVSLSKVSGDELTLCTSKLNSQFYAIFMTSGIVSGLFSTVVLTSGAPNAIQLLFTLLTFIGILAAFVLATVPQPEDMTSKAIDFNCTKLRLRHHSLLSSSIETKSNISSCEIDNETNSVSWWTDGEKSSVDDSTATATTIPSTSKEISSTIPTTLIDRPTLVYMLWFISHDLRLRLLIPAMFANGLIAGCFNGALLGVLFKGHLGSQLISLIGAIYCLVAAVASNYLWQRLSKLQKFGRRWSFATALLGYTIWYIFVSIYTFISPPPENSLSSTEFQQPSLSSLIFFTVLSITHGILDPVLNTFVPATLQVFFPTGKDLYSSMGSIRVFYSAGFALAQVLSISLLSITGKSMISLQCAIVSFIAAFAAICLYYLNTKICSIDLGKKASPISDSLSTTLSENQLQDKELLQQTNTTITNDKT
jgi:hypothetical protein